MREFRNTRQEILKSSIAVFILYNYIGKLRRNGSSIRFFILPLTTALLALYLRDKLIFTLKFNNTNAKILTT